MSLHHFNPTALSPATNKALQLLIRRGLTDPVFNAVVMMYRNVSLESETASYFMAQHDLDKYSRDGEFEPLRAGYDDRELEYLVSKRVKLV